MAKIFSLHTILLFLAFLFFFIAIPSPAMTKIGIVYRGDITLHQQLAEELSSAIQADNNYTTVLWKLHSDLTEKDHLFFRDEQLTQLIAIGDLALSFCMENNHDLQGIFLLVSSNELARQAELLHWQGARIWAPMIEQFTKAREILPNIRTVGVLISPTCQADKVLLNKTASELGFSLNLITVENRRQILPSLSRIFQQNDAILMLPDPGLMNNVVLTEMLRLQKRHRTPLIAVSKRFVDVGAFMSVDYRLEELLDKIAQKIRQPFAEDAEPPLPHCCLIVHINNKVAEQLRISIPTANTGTRIEFTAKNTGDQT